MDDRALTAHPIFILHWPTHGDACGIDNPVKASFLEERQLRARGRGVVVTVCVVRE